MLSVNPPPILRNSQSARSPGNQIFMAQTYIPHTTAENSRGRFCGTTCSYRRGDLSCLIIAIRCRIQGRFYCPGIHHQTLRFRRRENDIRLHVGCVITLFTTEKYSIQGVCIDVSTAKLCGALLAAQCSHARIVGVNANSIDSNLGSDTRTTGNASAIVRPHR